MSWSKKIDLKRDFAAGVYLYEEKPLIPPFTHCIRVYSILTHREGRGENEPERRGEGQQFTKPGRKYQHDWLYLQSINSDKHPRKLPLPVNFLGHNILPCLLWVLSSYMVITLAEIFQVLIVPRGLSVRKIISTLTHSQEKSFPRWLSICTNHIDLD